MGIFDFLRPDPHRRFADRVVGRLRASGFSGGVRYHPDQFALTFEDGRGTLYLDTLYREWLTYPASRKKAALEKAIDFLVNFEEDDSFAAVADKLLPVVRNRSHMENLWLTPGQGERGGYEGAIRPLGEHLAVLVAIDRPSSIAIAGARMLRDWGRPLDELLALAAENLRACSPCRFERQPAGYYVSDYGDYQDASRLLLPHLFEQLGLKGDPVVVPISRAEVVAAGSEDVDALNAMADHVEASMANETRPIGYAPLIYSGGEWRPFLPSAPDLVRLRELSVRQRFWDYAEQAALLEAHFQTTGEDVYVAPFEATDDEGVACTWTSWTEGVPALIPKADAVGLTTSDERRAMRRWEDIEKVCGPFEPEPGFFPARYRVGRWMDASMWARLEREFPSPAWFQIDPV